MASDPVLDSLELEDRIDLLVGRIARAHVELDGSLRNVAYHLAGFGSGGGIFLVGRGSTPTSRHVGDIRRMLDGLTGVIDERFRLAGLSTMTAAEAAGQARNEAVHDAWIRDGESVIQAKRPKRGGSGFDQVAKRPSSEFLEGALGRVRAAHYRVSMMSHACMYVLPWMRQLAAPTSEGRRPTVEDLLRAMEGELPGGLRTPPE